ncbi:hypothetical protein [Microvirga puerhi]|uniref:Surface antigen domain-containing protein n=1 Tax=Microvirga puerhi TaxID=2876078 RepID=A0ABS7VQK0_9HYPH|nr:hypothetical protein [Microvirga puerhi]MBZ6077831.1 hypothetical protein [Microvirga puerhi]
MSRPFILLVGLAVLLSACNQTGGARLASTAAGLDPTGIAGTAVGLAQSVAPAEEASSDGVKLSRMAARLRDVADGRTDRPNLMSAVDGQMSQVMMMQNMALANSIAQAAIGGAMSGGVGLLASAPGIAMQAATTGMANAQISAARSQVQSAMVQAEAERAAARIVPEADRPTEARAILSVIDGANGRSTTWRNPETGASGKVTVQVFPKSDMSMGLVCRLVHQEWKGSEGTRKGSMVACKQDGEWYDLS